jgi:hypothetical protein
MYKTLLLTTFEGIVGCKEIRHENSFVCDEQILQETAFSRIPEEIANRTLTGNDPDIADLFLNFTGVSSM